jgi:putative tryptophan/tyrosine transport system substrate-binding protein
MKRREFIGVLGGAAAWPVTARGQQQPSVPVIGFLGSGSIELDTGFLPAFRQGLADAGFVEGGTLGVEYRWAGGHYERLPELAADLVRRRVAAIVAGPPFSVPLAAKSATATIPIIFMTGTDPVERGLVTSLNRPGGNLTGVTTLTGELGPKRLELLHEVMPRATSAALLLNPTISPALNVEPYEAAARTLGLKLQVLHASEESEFESVFADAARLGVAGIVISPDQIYNEQSSALGALSVRHALPTVYQLHEFTAAGGLMSYGSNIADSWRLVGAYAGRVLKGEKPADLPVQQATRVELIINLKTAKALGLTVPLPLLGRADEVIE